MSSEPHRLAGSHFDVLVVGGGIHGLFTAYDAAQRGLSVALVERDDFGSGLSFNHQRTIHGGLRALEQANFAKVREQVAERRAWAVLTPHLIRPLTFLTGTYRGVKRSRWLIAAGMRAYNLIGRRRNAGLPADLRLRGSRVVSAEDALRQFPGIRRKHLTGGATWQDYQAVHPDRMNWSVALAASQTGALLVNGAEAIEPLLDGGRVVGARIRDHDTGRECDVHARMTVLCAGSALESVMRAFGVSGAPPLLRAMNLLVDRPAGAIGVAAPGQSGRMLTAVPWRGLVLAGTHQSRTVVPSTETAPPEAHLDEMLADVNAAFPGLEVSWPDVRLVHYGLTPARVLGSTVDLMPESQVVRHDREGCGTVISVIGVKFTTARRTAAQAVDLVCASLDRPGLSCRTAEQRLPHAISSAEARALSERLRTRHGNIAPDQLARLTSVYGGEAPLVLDFSAERGLTDVIGDDWPVLAGEIAYAATHARARHLTDAVLRRTALGATGHPGPAALTRAAAVMGEVRGWSADERAAEIARVEQRYAIRGR